MSEPSVAPSAPARAVQLPARRQAALDAIIAAITERAYWHVGVFLEQFVASATLPELLALREALRDLAARRRRAPPPSSSRGQQAD